MCPKNKTLELGKGETMSKTVSTKIGDTDFTFENSSVKVIANRNCPEIKLAGLNVGPFDEGNEYEIKYWIAIELQKFGVVRLREEEILDAAKIYKIQWKERAQTAGQVANLPDDFYSKFRRFLAESKKEASSQPEKTREYEKTKQLACDIVNSRVKKIVSLASAPAQTEQTLKNFTSEERFLYQELYKVISEWRVKILEYQEEEE
jgi:hypothetical protein